MKKQIKKIIFPVGGLGTRFLPATKSLPKEMLPVFNKPIIQYAFEEAVQAGIEEFIFITGRNKNAINNHFDHAYELQQVLDSKSKKKELELTSDWMPKAGQIAFVRQQEPLGLGHAVWCARNFIGNEPFAVILADELLKLPPKGFLSQMIEDYNKAAENINLMGVCEVPHDQTYKYGIIDHEKSDNGLLKIKNMIEKPTVEDAPSNHALIGRYILQPEIFKYLENQEKGSGGEIQLTDAMDKLRENQDFYASVFTGERFDCGSPMGYLDANISFGNDVDPEAVKEMVKKYV
jgi:UTP--glucose-1-phosphate uridylyltransferase